jgi:hypothetical protein
MKSALPGIGLVGIRDPSAVVHGSESVLVVVEEVRPEMVVVHPDPSSFVSSCAGFMMIGQLSNRSITPSPS